MTRPLVAVAGYVEPPSRIARQLGPRLVVPTLYMQALQRAGADPVVTSPGHSEMLLDRVHGVVLVGGSDIDPAQYKATPAPEVSGVDAERDASEIELVREALRRRTPVLAICRGSQLVNVALGGTLVQHLQDGPHRRQAPEPNAEWGVLHDIRTADDSRVFRICGASFAGWSFHHQALDRLGEGLTATAWGPEDVVEAVEHADSWMVGVQWHPELTAHEDASQQALFDAFVDEARRTRS